MAKISDIQLYYSTTPGAVPLPADLLPGELGLNLADQVAYFEDAAAAVKIFGATEKVYALAGTELNPAVNGTIQTKTIAANTTFTDALSAGQSMVLMLTGAGSYTITWPVGVVWISAAGNVAPTLTANDVVVLWKVSTTLYGLWSGSYATV